MASFTSVHAEATGAASAASQSTATGVTIATGDICCFAGEASPGWAGSAFVLTSTGATWTPLGSLITVGNLVMGVSYVSAGSSTSVVTMTATGDTVRWPIWMIARPVDCGTPVANGSNTATTSGTLTVTRSSAYDALLAFCVQRAGGGTWTTDAQWARVNNPTAASNIGGECVSDVDGSESDVLFTGSTSDNIAGVIIGLTAISGVPTIYEFAVG